MSDYKVIEDSFLPEGAIPQPSRDDIARWIGKARREGHLDGLRAALEAVEKEIADHEEWIGPDPDAMDLEGLLGMQTVLTAIGRLIDDALRAERTKGGDGG